jgi:hypothetical protein
VSKVSARAFLPFAQVLLRLVSGSPGIEVKCKAARAGFSFETRILVMMLPGGLRINAGQAQSTL